MDGKTAAILFAVIAALIGLVLVLFLYPNKQDEEATYAGWPTSSQPHDVPRSPSPRLTPASGPSSPTHPLDPASPQASATAGNGAMRGPTADHDQDDAEPQPVTSSTTMTGRGVRRSMLAFRSVMSALVSFVKSQVMLDAGGSGDAGHSLCSSACG